MLIVLNNTVVWGKAVAEFITEKFGRCLQLPGLGGCSQNEQNTNDGYGDFIHINE